MNPIVINYIFELSNGKTHGFRIELSRTDLSYISPSGDNLPSWTKLEVGQCSNCPLKPESHPLCPIAKNLASLVEEFKEYPSTMEAKITVATEERAFVKVDAVQEGLFSIFGIIMATSGCPVMDILKPMARFHLPFATSEETILRSTSFYLLRQYFEHKRGNRPDLDLTEMNKSYSEIEKVNLGMIQRIRTILHSGDANKNALVALDALAKLLAMAIEEKLEDLEYLFQTSPNTVRRQVIH